MKKLCTLAGLLIGFISISQAQIPSKYYQFDIAGASATYVTGNNNYGEIVGYCTIGGVTKGFYFNGVDTIIAQYQNNSSANTYFGAINNHHLIAGYDNTTGSSANNNPFIFNLFNGNYTDPYTPSSSGYTNIAVNGLNDQACISGQAKDGTIQNYFYNCAGGIFNIQEYANNVGGNFTQYATYGQKVNNNGYLTAFYIDGVNIHGLLYNGNANTYSVLDVPGATHTKAFGINNAKTIVGTYNERTGFMATPDPNLGYLSPHFTTVTPTGVGNIAQLFLQTINDSNQVAGYFVDSQSVTHGIFMGLIPGKLIFLNSVVNNPGFAAPYLLAISNNDINVVPTFKICADGSNATVFKFVCDTCSALTMQHLRFVVKSDPLGTDTTTYGTFDPHDYRISNDTLTVRFRHPQFITSSHSPFRSDSIIVKDAVANKDLYKNPIAIYRAPAVLVHGLAANQATFQAMNANFLTANLYPAGNVASGSPLVLRVDYSSTNMAHFSTNRTRVPDGIDAVYRQARAAGYSCGSTIVAGHSMGGVLSRLYLQSTYRDVHYRKDIQKLITVNTPHGGTQLPNYGMTFATNGFGELNALTVLISALTGYPVILGIALQHTVTGELNSFLNANGAFEDLSYTSQPTRHQLNIDQSLQEKVPSCTFGTNETGDNSAAANAVRGILSHAVYFRQIYCGDYNDLIVPYASQMTGVSIQPRVDGQIHVGATDDPTIIGRVEAYLDQDPADNAYFTHDGFPPNYLPTPHLLPVNTNPLIRSNGPDSIKILAPASGTVFNSGDVVSVNIYSSGNVPLFLLTVMGNSISPITIDTVNVTQIKFTIPANALGPLNLTLFGGDSLTFNASDTTTIMVASAVAPDSIICTPTQASVALGLTQAIVVTGYFSGSAIPLTGVPALAVQYDTTYLISRGNGSFQTKALGTTTVTFTYLGATASTVITIYDDSTQLSTAFDYTNSLVCGGGTVTFTPYSVGLVSSQHWSFPGGVPSTSTLSNPTITYATPGVYPVSLITTFVNGTDTSVLDSLIVVSVPPAQPVILANAATLTTASGYSYQWYHGTDTASMSAIVGALSDTLQITSSGYYSVMITDTNLGCSNISRSGYYNVTGVMQLNGNYVISVYPNPGAGLFNVKIGSPVDSKYNITVYDLLGQLVYTSEAEVKQGANSSVISLSNLTAGTYFLRVRSNDVEWHTTLVKN